MSNAGKKATAKSSASALAAVPVSSEVHAYTYELSAVCTVREGVALKSALLELLGNERAVTIDVRAVERIDTAALQLLCAFVRDRKAAGGQVLWLGKRESFCEAIRLLGLQQPLAVPDALMLGAA